MPEIVVELTNRCNLRCLHCFDKRHSAEGDLKLEIMEKILLDAKLLGFDYLSFTGGEPTMHPEFSEILAMVSGAGYRFGFVTNGWNFAEIYGKILPWRAGLSVITFSLDGALEETHDLLRGKGSYRRVMKAVSICVLKDISFTFNTVITRHNCSELEEMAELAAKLGSQGVRFGSLLPTLRTAKEGLVLSPEEQKELDAAIRQFQLDFPIPVVTAPGYYTKNLFPCAPLQMQEFNIDWQGNLTACCHLSGHGDSAGNSDVIDNLGETGLAEAYRCLTKSNNKFHKKKIELYLNHKFKDTDYFPCWYCLNYFKKVDWLKKFPQNPWYNRIWNHNMQKEINNR